MMTALMQAIRSVTTARSAEAAAGDGLKTEIESDAGMCDARVVGTRESAAALTRRAQGRRVHG